MTRGVNGVHAQQQLRRLVAGHAFVHALDVLPDLLQALSDGRSRHAALVEPHARVVVGTCGLPCSDALGGHEREAWLGGHVSPLEDLALAAFGSLVQVQLSEQRSLHDQELECCT